MNDEPTIDGTIISGDVIRFNFIRQNTSHGEYHQWSHTKTCSGHAPQYFGEAVVGKQ